jgi:hypothetical protein
MVHLHLRGEFKICAGIQQTLEQRDLTDDEREALERDRDTVAALAERLANSPTPAGSTPNAPAATAPSSPLAAVRESLRVPPSRPDETDVR